MQRLVSYISRCPFPLARMIKVSEGSEVIYRAGKSDCVQFSLLFRSVKVIFQQFGSEEEPKMGWRLEDGKMAGYQAAARG